MLKIVKLCKHFQTFIFFKNLQIIYNSKWLNFESFEILKFRKLSQYAQNFTNCKYKTHVLFERPFKLNK